MKSFTLDTIRDLFEYNVFARERMLEALETWGWDEVTANREASFQSVLGVAAHILGVEEFWLHHVLMDNPNHPWVDLDPNRFADAGALRAHHDDLVGRTRAYLAALRPEDLDRRIARTNRSGKRLSLETGDILIHVAFEEVHHRGELIALFYQLDREPPEAIQWMNFAHARERAGTPVISFSLEAVRDLFEYNFFVRDFFLDALSTWTWDEVVANREASWNSIRNILVHILNVEEWWVHCNLARKPDHPGANMRANAFASMEILRRHHADLVTRTRAFLGDLRAADLAGRVLPYDRPTEAPSATGDILLQVVFEEIHHRGELIALFYQLDREPPAALDWLSFALTREVSA